MTRYVCMIRSCYYFMQLLPNASKSKGYFQNEVISNDIRMTSSLDGGSTQ